ncbi:hypothetical protein ABEB36_014321 [Hypothenemus hampei]|uniref:Uncharacterized protein n=1 Tax=Hypothenemus hampei TaxID=57062 RepID=A0ABD1E4D3_HYPHA
MPIILLSRQSSTASLATIVEKGQRQPLKPHLCYDLRLNDTHLELILVSKSPQPIVPPKPAKDSFKSPVLPAKGHIYVADEGFESDIDSISLLSSENESFHGEKSNAVPTLNETDSANGGSGTDSETESDKTNTLTQKNVSSIKENFEKHVKNRESFDLIDCVCYTDVTHPNVLIFVINNEALVFKFDDLEELQRFYRNFTTLKAVTNQKSLNLATKYNLLQRTDQNGVTHIEIKKQNGVYKNGPLSIISIEDLENEANEKGGEAKQRTDKKLINELKFNTLRQRQKIIRCNSIENVLTVDNKESNLVKNTTQGLRKIWNSAEDLLADEPLRPERRRKKKPAPPPPNQPHEEDVYSGQFVRVNVTGHLDQLKEFTDKNRLVIKSTGNEPHPKKLGQNFLGRNNLSSLLKVHKDRQVLRYPQENLSLIRTQRPSLYEKNIHSSSSMWTNSVPRILKKNNTRCMSETRIGTTQQQPMAYRYIDTTIEPPTNNAIFLKGFPQKTSTEKSPKSHRFDTIQHKPRISFAYNVPGFISKQSQQENTIGNRVFGLTPKIKDFSSGKWGSTGDLIFLNHYERNNNLKSSIKSGEIGNGKKKNEKKVTFSAYTTVQVV